MSDIAHRPQQIVEERRTPQQELLAQVRGDDFKQQIALALPPQVKPDRFVRATATALLQTPELANAEPSSVFASLLKCAQDGLLPDGREAALVIYKDKNGNRKAQYLPMIGGYRKIAGEHGWALRTEVVYENDEFEYEEGLETMLRHRPARPGANRGARIAAYAIGVHRDGRRPMVKVLYEEAIARARQKAQTQSVWNEWTDRMWEKTVGKLLFKSLPLDQLDERVRRLIELSELEPPDAAELMYGPQARAAFATAAGEAVNPETGEITAGPATPTPGTTEVSADDAPAEPQGADTTVQGGGEGTSAGAGDQQDAAVATEIPSPPAAASPGEQTTLADHGEEEDDPPLGERKADIVERAAQVVVPRGDKKGLTLREIDEYEGAAAWFAKNLARAPGYWPADFLASLRTYVEAKHPDLLAA